MKNIMIIFCLLLLTNCNKNKSANGESFYQNGEVREGLIGTFVTNNFGEFSCGNLFQPEQGQENFQNFGILPINVPDSVFSEENWGRKFRLNWEFLGMVKTCKDGTPDYNVSSTDEIPNKYVELVRLTSIEYE